MDTIKKLFPYSFGIKSLKNLIVTIIVYLVADLVCGLVIGILDGIPLVGGLLSLVGGLLGLYFTVGIILAILSFLGLLKD